MKFYAAAAVYVLMGVILGAGIYEAVYGHYWLLAAGVIAYLAALIKLGCLPPSKSH